MAPCPAALTPARALAALHAIATATTRGAAPTALVRLAVEVARECLGVDAAAVCRWRPQEARLVCLASTEPSEVATGLALQLDAGPAALAFHWRRTMIVEGPSGTDGAELWPSAPPTQTLAAVPLVAGGSAAGVRVVRTHGAYHYGAEHTRFLHLLAALIAPASSAALPPGAALIAPDATPGPHERPAAPPSTAGQGDGERAADVDLGRDHAWALCQAVTCGVLVTDEEGRIARSNEPAARLLGLDTAALRGQPLESILTLAGEDGAALAPEQHPVARARRGHGHREALSPARPPLPAQRSLSGRRRGRRGGAPPPYPPITPLRLVTRAPMPRPLVLPLEDVRPALHVRGEMGGIGLFTIPSPGR